MSVSNHLANKVLRPGVGQRVRYGNIVMGWIATPILAGVISFFGLYFLQNVFDQTVF